MEVVNNTTFSAKDAELKFYIARPLAKLGFLESIFCGVLTWKMHERDQSVCMHSDHKQLLEMTLFHDTWNNSCSATLLCLWWVQLKHICICMALSPKNMYEVSGLDKTLNKNETGKKENGFLENYLCWDLYQIIFITENLSTVTKFYL